MLFACGLPDGVSFAPFLDAAFKVAGGAALEAPAPRAAVLDERPLALSFAFSFLSFLDTPPLAAFFEALGVPRALPPALPAGLAGLGGRTNLGSTAASICGGRG